MTINLNKFASLSRFARAIRLQNALRALVRPGAVALSFVPSHNLFDRQSTRPGDGIAPRRSVPAAQLAR